MTLRRQLMKGTAALLLLVLCLGMAPAATAAAGVSDKAVMDLKAFDILQGDETGDLQLEEDLTRAEFAAMVARLLRVDEIPVPDGQSPWTDVQESDWFYGPVSILRLLGLIDGYGSGTFGPEDTVTMPQAVKVLVSALGYSVVAQQNGGFPNGYTATASTIGLLKNYRGSDGTLTRGDAAQLLYNALDIDAMEVNYGLAGGPGYSIAEGHTLRSAFLEENQDAALYKGKGIITANYYIGLYRDIASIEEDQVEIGGKLYFTGNTGAAQLLGQEVEFYARRDESGQETLTQVRATNQNNILELDEESLIQVSGDYRFTYMDADEKRRTGTLSPSLRYIKNNQLVLDYQLEEIALENGTVRFVDNDGDEAYDLVFVEDYQSLRVDRVQGNNVYFADNRTFAGSRMVSFDAEDRDVKYIVENTQGQAIPLDALLYEEKEGAPAPGEDQIQKDSIISLLYSQSGNTLKCIVSNQKLEGMLESFSEPDAAVVAGEERSLAANCRSDAAVGDAVTAYLDFNEKICEIKKQSDDSRYQYGYVIEAGLSGGVSGACQIKLLLPGKLVPEVEIDDSDENNVSSVPILKCYNSGVEVLEVNGSVQINGASRSAMECLTFFQENEANRVIYYTKNSEGKVNRIETPEFIGSGPTKTYNAYERVFGVNGTGVFAIDDDSVGLCIPDPEKGPVNSDEDYYATIQLNDNQSYKVRGYDLDDTTRTAGAIVITTTLDASAAQPITTNSKMAVASGVKRIIDAEGENRWQLTFWSEGQEMTRLTRVENGPDAEAAQMKMGDVFYYAENFSDEIAKIQVIARLGKQENYFDEGSDSTDRMTFGVINDVVLGDLDAQQNRRVHTVTLTVNETFGTLTTVKINARNTPPVYVYDKNEKTVRAGTIDDVTPTWKNASGTPVRLFTHTTYSKMRGIVVVK